MREALKQAQKAFELGEVPVGAVLVFQNEIIATSHNLIEFEQDATQHAEIICIKNASKYLKNWRLQKATLYCTLEPCAMCAGAMILARLDTLVWGAPDIRHGASHLFDHPIHKVNVRSGVLQEESAELMRSFFQARRVCGKII